ncbi:hypothetical protein G7Y89_g3801 [Cudoniella acicularis]|uniref:Heterokaryon incompatibility domain-containing protein n=1 Tax=Cudoniella acicularis TaxID=354080 RepID=A0A8H4RQP2_9HELO|nr:hypothetical protein G7Y89_g3801 [Cudoniella acicularis]
MGYSQIWEIRSSRRWAAAWPRLISDTRTIVDAADIDLTSDRIWDMNEVETYYGGSEEALRKLLDPPPVIVDVERGILFNGIQNDGCEPFFMDRHPKPMYEHSKKLSYSCKTNRRPYDTVVCAVLIRAKQLLGDAFYAEIPSRSAAEDEDGGWWKAFSLIELLWPDDEIMEESDGFANEEYGSDVEEIDHLETEQRLVKPTIKAGAELQILKESENGDMDENFQRPLLPLELSDERLNTFRQWINHCDTTDTIYGTCHSTGHQRHLPLLRLIDVEKGCVVSAPPNPSYVALSYVWGKLPQTCLLSSNIEQLLENDGFRKHDISISKTIADAMALCQRLGHRYLWVDAYCMLQDNAQDKALQLNTMRDVYSNAVFTIVAANGDHANSGLGLAGRENSTFAMTERSDTWASFSHALSKTIWETRGWTFQEKALSRRLLVFSPDGPFFICGARICNEHGFQKLNPNAIDRDRPGRFFNIKSGNQLELYLAAVTNYSKRELTMEADFENAMNGITKAFAHSIDGRPNSFYAGFPTSFFDDIFCWRVEEHNPDARRWGFPSWSWQDWKQTPIFPDIMMASIDEKRKKGLWGSRILAYDRGNYKNITRLDSFCLNVFGPNPLMLEWRGAPLEVAMECNEDIGPTNGLFRVFSYVNGQSAGVIQLHKEWRARQPAKMEFLPVFVENKNGELKIKVLMCLEQSKQPSRAMADPKNSWERVQLMDCDIGEQDWKSMIDESLVSSRYRLVYALASSKVAGAVTQTGVYDYRVGEASGKYSHLGAPVTSVEIFFKDTKEYKTTDAMSSGEIWARGPAVVSEEVSLGVNGKINDDLTLSLL